MTADDSRSMARSKRSRIRVLGASHAFAVAPIVHCVREGAAKAWHSALGKRQWLTDCFRSIASLPLGRDDVVGSSRSLLFFRNVPPGRDGRVRNFHPRIELAATTTRLRPFDPVAGRWPP